MPANYDRPYPEHCSNCGDIEVGPEHWKWNPHKKAHFGGTWKCREQVRAGERRYQAKKRADPARMAKHKTYMAEYYLKHPNYTKYKAYRNVDNRKYGGASLEWPVAESLMELSCFYCEVAPSNGLDRRDNTTGHTPDNVVPCCAVCNMILTDLPAEVKDLLASGLREARQKGLLETWVPPQMRK